ncbi:MAG TPA: hypothetical protein PKA10_07130 [Selenomonadales bacterium]|nr:hypothetical protein [Selenomonadales bacterium]
MREFQFAAAMEASIRQELERFMESAPQELQAALTMIGRFQAEFELLLDRAQLTNVDAGSYPEVNGEFLLGADSSWQQLAGDFGVVRDKTAANLTVLWAVHALMEKSGQFYQQAALNSAHPATRLLMASLGEVKSMARRRVDGLLRVIYNEVWADVGFAPSKLGKD